MTESHERRESVLVCEIDTLTDVEQILDLVGRNVMIRTDSTLSFSEFNPQYDDFSKRVGRTTPNDPAILIETGATSCTLLFAIDAEGNAAIFHEPFALVGDLIPGNDEFQRQNFSSLLDQVEQSVRENPTVFVGGQYELGEAQRNEQRKMIEERIRDIYYLKDTTGIVLVPKYLSKDGKSHIFLVPKGKDHLLRQLIDSRII